MKHLAYDLIFSRDARLSGAIAFGIVTLIALGCTCGKNLDFNSNSSSSSNSVFGNDSDSGVPDDIAAKQLIKSTTASFTDAIRTEDFSRIYEDASDDFKHTYTEQQMKAVFKDFIDKKSKVLPILDKTASMEPDFTSKPSFRTEGGSDILVLDAKYATKPVPVKVHYEYIKRGGEWKMLILKIFLT